MPAALMLETVIELPKICVSDKADDYSNLKLNNTMQNISISETQVRALMGER